MKNTVKVNIAITLLATTLVGCAKHERQLSYSGLDYVQSSRMQQMSDEYYATEPQYHYYSAKGFANTKDIAKAFNQYKRTGKKSPIIGSGFVTQPFDPYSKVLVGCSPNQSAQIMLEAGEEITGMHLDNPTMWDISKMTVGNDESKSTLVIVTPQKLGIATNLTIGTNKRVYSIGFISKKGLSPIVNFWYPDDIARDYEKQKQMIKERQQRQFTHDPGDKNALSSLDNLHLQVDYHVNGSLSVGAPESIYNNGKETVVYWSALQNSEAPIVTIKDNNQLREVKSNYDAPYLYIAGTYPELTLFMPSQPKRLMNIVQGGA